MIFRAVLDQLNALSVLVYAQSAAEARQRVAAIADAMQETDAPFDVRAIQWEVAARELQPVRPVLPGVQFVLSYLDTTRRTTQQIESGQDPDSMACFRFDRRRQA